MRIGFQLLLGYVLIAILACYMVFNIFLTEVKPTVRRATEGMLNDTASLLATIVSQELTSLNEIKNSTFAQAFEHVNEVPIRANIDGIIKNEMAFRVYITDINGIVIFDSDNRDVGKDYSRWNDVYLTLRGKYGVRTSLLDPKDPTSTVMYVAAPLKINNELVGVLTVAKPNQAMAVVINKGERRILWGGAILISIALLIGIFVIIWVDRGIKKLVKYADQVSNHEATNLPKLGSPELRSLGNAIENMRLKLEGKDYIEKYVHTLAHELKSPLSSMRAATEILQDSTNNMPLTSPELRKLQNTHKRFLENIDQQTERMLALIDRMLQLVRLESRASVNLRTIYMQDLIREVVNNKLADAQLHGINLKIAKNEDIKLKGDRFLIIQALSNLLSNALDFTSSGGEIVINGFVKDNNYLITVTDTGTGIPEFALKRIYERFYSLPRPNKGKSSGLGLPFVKEVALLHHGNIELANRTDNVKGSIATLTLKIH